jgi:hypothetical protein
MKGALMIKVGSCVQFKKFVLYHGETLPDIPVEEWTGEVISSSGVVRIFHKVRRHFDNRIILVMEKDLIISDRVWVDKPIEKEVRIKKFNVASDRPADPLLQTLAF